MSPPPVALRPDTLLHIYYVAGILPPHQTIAAEHFLGNWVEDDFSFLFFTRPAAREVEELLRRHPGTRLLDQYEMTYGQWQGGNITPLRIGRFLLNPPWIKASPAKGEIAITVDAGLVFGNGTHPTTQDCLTAIDIACSGGKVTTMLDLGTGTGVLALAAARLGCARIVAVDYNYLAARTARGNVGRNDLDDRILVVNGRAEEHLSVATDLLVANIHYQVMKDLVASEGFLRQKWFVLSGLLRSEAAKIEEVLKTLPVLILKRWDRDNIWHTILGITTV